MKFGKYFKRQKVPEWTEAYMDYNGLKKILGEIVHYKRNKEDVARLQNVQQNSDLYRSYSGLFGQSSSPERKGDIEDQVIDVQSLQVNGSRRCYETRFLRECEDGGEIEANFFRKLDEELNKVNAFYKDKVAELMHEASLLDKQMDALIALRIKVDKPDFDGSHPSPEPLQSDNIVEANASGNGHIDDGEHTKIADESQPDQITNTLSENKGETAGPELSPLHISTSDGKGSGGFSKQDPLEVLDRVKIHNTLQTPMSTLKGVLKNTKDFGLSFKKVELRKVEERLRAVFIEFYQKLRLLKLYSFMNLSAISKIMKKYDKVTSRRASRSYMKMVDNSYLSTSDEITSLLVRVEAIFVKHFSNSNRREGMKLLRPKAKKEKHRVTFFSGFFSGCSVALVVAVVLRIEARNLMDKEEGALYMENIFPLYSFFGYIVLHMLMYAGDIFFWRRYRVNHPFIFGFKQGTELGYREVFLLSSGLAVLALASFLVNLHLDMGTSTQNYKTFIELVPLGLATVVLAIIFCPFNIIYRLSRFFFIRCIFHCICAPLYQVRLPDFFLADNLASQVQAMRSIELYICYYGLGEYSQRQNRCHSHGAYNVFYYIVAVVPYWIRFVQCLRRFCEDREKMHGFNCLKYMLTIVAVVIRTAFELQKGKSWLVLALVSSVVATIANTYWDIVVDWGLLRRHSRNFYLRDKLQIPHKSVYYVAMVLNIILRLAWMNLVLESSSQQLRKFAVTTTSACLEIIRRGIWNFFRLENEHLNNVGKYRAFKSVPHPFNYYDEDDDEDSDKED